MYKLHGEQLNPRIAALPKFPIWLKSTTGSQGKTKINPQFILLLCFQTPNDEARPDI